VHAYLPTTNFPHNGNQSTLSLSLSLSTIWSLASEGVDRVSSLLDAFNAAPDASKNGLSEFIDVAQILKVVVTSLSHSSLTPSTSDLVTDLTDVVVAYAQELSTSANDQPFTTRQRTILEAVNGIVACHASVVLADIGNHANVVLDFIGHLEHDALAKRLWSEKFGVEVRCYHPTQQCDTSACSRQLQSHSMHRVGLLDCHCVDNVSIGRYQDYTCAVDLVE
jgi:hypothetical protein